MHKPHKNLNVWQKAMELVQQIYKVTADFPNDEKYGLSAQMRRAAISIPSNLAEGAARQSDAEFSRFIHIALGSASELDTQIELSQRLGLLLKEHTTDLDNRLTEIDKMLIGLRNSLREGRE